MRIADKQTIVLVSGKAGVGKTTFSIACDTVAKNLTFRSGVYSFAGRLKEIALEIGWNKQKDEKGRALLQDLGRVAREYDIDTWAKILWYSILSTDDFVFIDDWRFVNEYEYFKEQTESDQFNLIAVKIVAPDREILRGTTAYNDVSEVGLDSFDEKLYNYIIHNDGQIEDLYIKALDVMKEIKKNLKIW